MANKFPHGSKNFVLIVRGSLLGKRIWFNKYSFSQFFWNLSGKLFRLLMRFVSAGLSKMQLMSLKWLFEEEITFEEAIYNHVSFLSLRKTFGFFSKELLQGCQNGYHVSKGSFWKKITNFLEKSIFSFLYSHSQWDKILISSQ